MAENPRFNNSGMFTNSGDNYSDIEPNSASEVLATQGNVINSIKVFWNKLRAKLAYAVTRPNFDAVGGNHQPVYVNNSGDVAPCSPSVFQTTVNSSTINLPEAFPIYAGQVICFNVTNGSGDNSGDLKIRNISVYYPTGATVKGSDVIGGSYLFTYISGNGDKWILNNKINVVDGNNAGLMTVAEHNKLHGIQDGANAYSLPAATDSSLGGVQLGYKENEKNYQVKKDNNNNLFVNVPWTDTDTHNTARVAMTVDKSDTPNITLTNSDGSGSSSIQVVGLGGTQVTMGEKGQLVINSQSGVTYNDLLDEDLGEQTPVTVPYPSQGRRKATRFLNGLGEWVTSTDKLYAGQNLTITNDSALGINANTLTGTLTIYNAAGERVPCAFLIVKSDNTTDVVSSGYGTLNFANYSVNLPIYGVKYIPYFPINDEINYQTQYMPGVVKISRPTSSSIKYNVL